MHSIHNRLHTRAIAAVCALGMCLTLTACSNDSNSSNDSAKSSSTNSETKSNTSDNASSDMTQIAGLTAKGDLGKKPEISFRTPMTVKDNSYAILQEGNGETVNEGDRVCTQGVAINVKDGSELMSTWEKNTQDCSLLLSAENIKQSSKLALLVGKKINTTVAFGINDSNSAGTSYIMALTIVSKSKDLTRATGDAVKNIPADMPKVTLDKNGKPSIDMNGYKPDGKNLVSQTLIRGKGAKVTKNNTAVVKYTGWLTNGKQFDSSWDRNATFDADVSDSGQIISGWKQGLIGKTAGSQVLLVIPPSLGYGDQESGSIPANSTLVFVIDILAVY